MAGTIGALLLSLWGPLAPVLFPLLGIDALGIDVATATTILTALINLVGI
jgi:hypothetical protein